ncbi:MAG: 30S ribosomal protein S21 [Marinilabiliales bacterium]|jgi:small subunit ribosomal protein S21|nr:MAG: 30S ribosomal protein S21 [Marinilabiliales bacterium]PLX07267.1 MAG: 30S ribosomal protein S21 [Marinilabiliales bacterium]
MIIIPIKEGENIDRALKRFKRKFEKTGAMKELRARQRFTKPSIVKREQNLKAIYVQKLRQAEQG